MGNNLLFETSKSCVRLSTFKQVSAVTRSVPSSGRLSPTSTELTLPVPTTETPTSNSRGSTSTSTRQPEAVTSPAPSSWISSPVPWTPSVLDPSDNSSAPTTSCSVRLVPVTTGPRDITPKVLSSPTPSLSPTTPPSLSINSSRTPMRLCALTTRPSTISASGPSSSPPPPTVTLTISSPLPSPVSPAASVSPVNSTLTSGKSP